MSFSREELFIPITIQMLEGVAQFTLFTRDIAKLSAYVLWANYLNQTNNFLKIFKKNYLYLNR